MKRAVLMLVTMAVVLQALSVLGFFPSVMAASADQVEARETRCQLIETHSDWPMFLHDLRHTGCSPSSAPATNNTLWVYAIGGRIHVASPIAADGVVYMHFYETGKLYAINATNGKLIWDFTAGNAQRAPAVAHGVIYVGCGEPVGGKIYALNATTGASIWSYDTGETRIGTEISVADGMVFFGTFDWGRIFALNASTGALIWKYSTSSSHISSSPAVVDGILYIGAYWENKVYAMNASTGAILWQYETGWVVGPSPSVVEGIVYVGSHDHKLHAINATTGSPIWIYTTGDYVRASTAVAHGVVYVGSADGNFYALNATTGALKWVQTIGETYSPAVADGKIYVGSSDYRLYCLNETTGETIWTYETGGRVSPPAIADGKVFVASDDGKIYCFGGAFLAVQTEPESLTSILGEGWYAAGANVELTAPPFVPCEEGEDGVRYQFDYWDVDRMVMEGNPIIVYMNVNHTATVHYVKQYYLTVTSPYGTMVGQGWYDAEDIAYATLASGTISGGTGIQYVFTGWSGDATGTSLTSNPIKMDDPKTVVANWKTQYYLTVISPYDTPGGEGWYGEGETAYATLVDGFVVPNVGFVGWSGDVSGWDLISDPITMDAPKTAIANWEASLIYGDIRTVGFWKHQVNVWYFIELKNSGMKIRGIGTAQISEEVLIAYLTFIDSNSDYFSGKIVGSINLDTLRNAYNILKTPTGPDSMKMRAEQQLFAVWLNLAHNAFFWNTQLSQDTLYTYWQYTYDENNGLATIGEAILFCEAELLKPDGTYEAAKNICDSINNNLGIIWGT